MQEEEEEVVVVVVEEEEEMDGEAISRRRSVSFTAY